MARNMELFDEYAARILADLYEAFPVKKPLNASDYCGHSEINDYGEPIDENGNPSKAFHIARATIEWLIETGYIRSDGMWQYGAKPAVLTPMGLAVLKAAPEQASEATPCQKSLAVKETTGDKLVRLIRAGSADAAKDVVRATIAGGAALITSQFG